MDIHKNARLTPILREELANKVLSRAVTLNSAAAEFKVTAKTAAKWVRRFQQQGRPGLQDSVFPSSAFAAALPVRAGRPGRTVAPPTLDRIPHRAHHRTKSCHRQPHPAPTSPQSHSRSGTGCAHRAL